MGLIVIYSFREFETQISSSHDIWNNFDSPGDLSLKQYDNLIVKS